MAAASTAPEMEYNALVQRLIEPPYSMSGITVVSLDSKGPDELVHLLCECFAAISPLFEVRGSAGRRGACLPVAGGPQRGLH